MSTCRLCGERIHDGHTICRDCRAEQINEQFVATVREAYGDEWVSVDDVAGLFDFHRTHIANRLLTAHQRGLLERKHVVRKEDGRRIGLYRVWHRHGRRCAYPGCSTIISSYNPRPVCYAHERAAIDEGLYEGSYLEGVA